MALIIGEYYRLKSTPNYSWVKVLRILKPNTPQNKNRFVVAECEHSVNKNDLFGIVRLFRLHEILPNKACSGRACACATPKLLWKESSGWYCGICYKPARR